ncbi:SIMPL domain-containing protein, partial [Xanthomonas campestris]
MKRIVGWMLAGALLLPVMASAQINTLPSQPHLLVKGQ